LEKILGVKGEAKEGMFKAVIGRKARMAYGCEAGKDMGVNTWAAFMGTDEKAVVDGDFIVLESELQGVLRSLRKSGIDIVAIHHHMVGETPRMLFLHYWGRGQGHQHLSEVPGWETDTLVGRGWKSTSSRMEDRSQVDGPSWVGNAEPEQDRRPVGRERHR
jgi:hypothetical protein